MRITFLCPHLRIAGGVRAILSYADRLARRGHQVQVVVPAKGALSALWRSMVVDEPEWMSPFRAHIRWVAEWRSERLPDGDVVVATAWQSGYESMRRNFLNCAAPQLPELRRAAADIKRAVEQDHVIAHPLEASLRGISGTIFTGPPNSPSADLRNVTIFADGQVDRSPCGTGTAAVMAVVDAMGLLAEDRPFVHESILGGELKGHVAGRTTVADRPAIVTSIAGEAWITGEHDFLIDDDDPLKDGFRI